MFQRFKDNIVFIVTIIALVLLMLVIHKCDQSIYSNNQGVKNDTTYIIKHTTDTIWTNPKVIHDLKVVISKPRVDTVYKPIYLDSGTYNRIYVYIDSISDSNLVWRYKAYTQGVLRDLKSNYSLKVPLRITDNIETIKAVKLVSKFEFNGALILSKGILAPGVEVGLKRFKIGLGYNLYNNSPIFSASMPIYKKY